MDAYSTYQTQVILACGIFAVLCLLVSPFAKRSGAPTPVLGVSILVALIGSLGFSLTDFAATDQSNPILETAITSLKDLPIAAVVSYACLLQARHYSLPHSTNWVRETLTRAPYTIWIGFFVFAALGAFQRPPLLEVGNSLPLWTALYSSTLIIPLVLYGAFTAYVFMKAATEPFTIVTPRSRTRKNLQNVCGAVALAAYTVLAASTYVWYCGRALLPEQGLESLAATMSDVQIALIGTAILASATGIVCYCSQDAYEKVMEELVRVAEPVCDITELFAAAPVSDSRLNRGYAYFTHAAGDQFLNLSDVDRGRADDAFRAGAVMNVGWKSTMNNKYERVKSGDLLHLAKMHDEASEYTQAMLTDKLVYDQTVYFQESLEHQRYLLYRVISFVLELSKGNNLPELSQAEEWAQLAALGLAEAEAIPSWVGNGLLDGQYASEDVYAYFTLAKLDLQKRRYR